MRIVFLRAISQAPADPSERPITLVLLHGLAADENDLFGLASELDPGRHVVSFRAPFETGYGGFSWFGIEFLADGRRIIDEDQAAESLQKIVDSLEELASTNPSGKLILAGFSQGAMMTAGVAFQRPDLIDAAWIMSGRYLPSLDPGTSPSRLGPILQQHGVYDEVLSVTEGRELQAVLRQKGYILKYEEYPMGHQISMESLRDADAWIRDAI